MANEEIIAHYNNTGAMSSIVDLLDLARADEREKMTQEKFAEYFNTLQGGEVASAILTQLLRRGVTDDDLRGLRLQWIKEQPEENNFYCADWDRCGTTCEEQCAACAKTDNLEQPEGVEVWVSWDGNNSMVAPEIWIMRPRPNMNGTFTGKVHHDAISSELNLSPGECAKFKIVRVE